MPPSQIPFTAPTEEALARLTLDERMVFLAAAGAVAGDQKPSLEVIVTLVLTVQRLISEAAPEAPLSKHVPVRFPEDLAAAAKRLAQQDGMSTSAWIRQVVDRELAARSGTCPTCGQKASGPEHGSEEPGHG